MNKINSLTVDCICADVNHISRLEYFPPTDNDSIPELFWNVQMNFQYPWWRRIWNATQYLFGRQSRFGHWDCGNIGYDSAGEIIKLLEQYRKDAERLDAKL